MTTTPTTTRKQRRKSLLLCIGRTNSPLPSALLEVAGEVARKKQPPLLETTAVVGRARVDFESIPIVLAKRCTAPSTYGSNRWPHYNPLSRRAAFSRHWSRIRTWPIPPTHRSEGKEAEIFWAESATTTWQHQMQRQSQSEPEPEPEPELARLTSLSTVGNGRSCCKWIFFKIVFSSSARVPLLVMIIMT